MRLWDICLQKNICLGGADWRRLVYTDKVKVNGETVTDWEVEVNKGDIVTVGKRIKFVVE